MVLVHRASHLHVLSCSLWILSAGQAVYGVEGMFPISELPKLNLSRMGIELRPEEVVNPASVSLMHGICRVNGCSGAFVSQHGLILTNHHCAYQAIQQASSPDRDLLTDGFHAASWNEEIPANGYVVKVTESYSDVSDRVLSAVQPGMDYLARTKAIEKRCRELEAEAEAAHPGLRAEVAEMFIGRTYFLFFYTFLPDVRLVFAPPASIGNFGGEEDNWRWPRHTGDFAFMRAYTSPDGSSAPFSPGNIPFRPKKVISVQPAGVQEGEVVFLLGYPGKTVRHRSAGFLELERDVRLPLLVEHYAWQMGVLDSTSREDPAARLKAASRFKSLANVEKRSRGQILGMNRAGIVESARQQEAELLEFIRSDSSRQSRFGDVLNHLERFYTHLRLALPLEFELEQLRAAPRLATAAWFLIDAAHERRKPDVERELPYIEKNYPQSLQSVQNAIRDFHLPADRALLRGILQRLESAVDRTEPGDISAQAIREYLQDPDRVDRMLDQSRLRDLGYFMECARLPLEELERVGDPLLDWMRRLYPTYLRIRQLNKERDGELNELYGRLLEVKQMFLGEKFIPDANGTLRWTAGRIRGYSPADAVQYSPISTFRGVMEKTTGHDPFLTPAMAAEAWRDRRFGPYGHPSLQDIPVAILYDADTTGGNSGSAVFNARGQLVGVNFDRTFEATINDFAWSSQYSRSIGVDIRYILWLTDTVFAARNLISEMGLEGGASN